MGISKRLYVGAVVLLAGCGETGGDTGMDPSSDPPVTATVDVRPKTVTLLALGDTTRFTAAAKTADGTTIPGRAFTWTSSNTRVVTVERGAGLVTAIDNGTAAIQATADAIQGSASVTVSQFPASVGVTPSADTLVSVGQTEQLTALALGANDNPIPGIAFTWSSSDETVATVDAAGIVTAVDNGSVTISATTANVVGTADVHFDQALGTIAVEPDEITLDSIGGTAQLTARARDANGHTIPGTTFVWSSADHDVAMVTPGGLVTAVGNDGR